MGKRKSTKEWSKWSSENLSFSLSPQPKYLRERIYWESWNKAKPNEERSIVKVQYRGDCAICGMPVTGPAQSASIAAEQSLIEAYRSHVLAHPDGEKLWRTLVERA